MGQQLALGLLLLTAPMRADKHGGASILRNNKRLYLIFETSEGDRYVESGFDSATNTCTSWYGREMVQQMSQHATASASASDVDSHLGSSAGGASSLLMLGLGGGMLIAQLFCQQQAVVDSVLAVELSSTIIDMWWRDFYPTTVKPCLTIGSCYSNRSRSNSSTAMQEVHVVQDDAIAFTAKLAANRTLARGISTAHSSDGCFRFIVVDCFAMDTASSSGGSGDGERVRPAEPSFTPTFLGHLRSLMCADDALLLINTAPTDYDTETMPLVAVVSKLFNDVRVRRKRRELLSGYNVVIAASVRPQN